MELIRVEAFTINLDLVPDLPFRCGFARVGYSSVPYGLALPTAPPSSIRVTSINGQTVNATSFTFPDVVINSVSPVTVNVQANYIPVGIVPKIIVLGETGPDKIVDCSPLQGNLQQTTCTAQIAFVSGGSRGYVKATW